MVAFIACFTGVSYKHAAYDPPRERATKVSPGAVEGTNVVILEQYCCLWKKQCLE